MLMNDEIKIARHIRLMGIDVVVCDHRVLVRFQCPHELVLGNLTLYLSWLFCQLNAIAADPPRLPRAW